MQQGIIKDEMAIFFIPDIFIKLQKHLTIQYVKFSTSRQNMNDIQTRFMNNLAFQEQ